MCTYVHRYCWKFGGLPELCSLQPFVFLHVWGLPETCSLSCTRSSPGLPEMCSLFVLLLVWLAAKLAIMTSCTKHFISLTACYFVFKVSIFGLCERLIIFSKYAKKKCAETIRIENLLQKLTESRDSSYKKYGNKTGWNATNGISQLTVQYPTSIEF